MLLELAIDLFWPHRESKTAERIVEKGTTGTLPVQVAVPGAFARRLNESGWVDGEVIAAGMLRQGKPPSLLALLSGAALFHTIRARRSKSLPREFALAVTADRVVAFAISPWKEGESLSDSVAVVRIKPGERGSWPRGAVRLAELHTRVGTTGGTLQLGIEAPFPVMCERDPSSDGLIELLNR